MKLNKVFSILSASYGHVWNSNFKSNDEIVLAMKVWNKKLSCFNDLVLEKALDEIIGSFPMPPTLPQLYMSCIDASNKIKKVSEIVNGIKQLENKNV